MSFGSTAYQSYVRIHVESGNTRHQPWESLTHLRRMAWEAAAQAVALAVLPRSMKRDSDEDLEDDDSSISNRDTDESLTEEVNAMSHFAH